MRSLLRVHAPFTPFLQWSANNSTPTQDPWHIASDTSILILKETQSKSDCSSPLSIVWFWDPRVELNWIPISRLTYKPLLLAGYYSPKKLRDWLRVGGKKFQLSLKTLNPLLRKEKERGGKGDNLVSLSPINAIIVLTSAHSEILSDFDIIARAHRLRFKYLTHITQAWTRIAIIATSFRTRPHWPLLMFTHI